MKIRLPFNIAADQVDFTLSLLTNVSFERVEAEDHKRVIFTLRFKELDASSWKILINKLDEYQISITFPVYVRPSEVFPLPNGGTIVVLKGKVKLRIKKIDKEKYNICHSIWLQLKLQEREFERSTEGKPMKTAYDQLAIDWVERPDIPKKNIDEFLQAREYITPVLKRDFYRSVLPEALKKGFIGKRGRLFVPKE